MNDGSRSDGRAEPGEQRKVHSDEGSGPPSTGAGNLAPILAEKHYGSRSAFTPESLLREARRQKAVALQPVPDVCLLNPDGDIVRALKAEGRAELHPGWACYHTELFVFEAEGITFGIVGGVVGASFAVLVAEELFAAASS